MRVFSQVDQIPAGFGPSVVAIGKFDGVHTGHRAVLDRARVDAVALGAQVVAVTFDRNPLALLRPELCPPELVSVQQKVDLLAREGVDAAVVLTFDDALAQQVPEDFVRETLVGALGVVRVLVGEDFRFGRGGAGDPALLTRLGLEYGFQVEIVEDVGATHDGRRVSSTWIRELLDSGDAADAARLLGRSHSVRGEVVRGLQRGRELGYPTANLGREVQGFIPGDGVYAGWLIDLGVPGPDSHLRPRTRYRAAISVGTNPTFDDVKERQVEAYVLDETDLDLYGHIVEVYFAARVREMVAFASVDELTAQMADDVDRVRRYLRRDSVR